MSYRFHGQRQNESVLLIARQHPFRLLHPLLLSVLVLLIPSVAYIFMPLGNVLSVIMIISLVVALTHGALVYYGWSKTLFILTNERVLFLEQKGLINREFVECTLASIQQVSHEVKGVWQTMLGYGTVSLYTGDSSASLFIRDVPDPYEIQQEIQRAGAGEAELIVDEEAAS